MKLKFNDQLLEKLEQHMPVKSDQVVLVMDVISLGKEAAYRRLRGEVLFTFDEACKIAAKLGVSLDGIAQTTVSDTSSTFELTQVVPNEIDDYCSYYYNQILTEGEEFDLPLTDPTLFTMSASCTVPHSMMMPFPTLFRFRAFQWIFQVDKNLKPIKMADVVPSAEMVNRQKNLIGHLDQHHEQIFILDRRIFSTLVDEILYFCDLQLISEEEKVEIKRELVEMINKLESVAIQGRTPKDRYVWLFKSNIDFETNYTYIRGKDFEMACLNIYQMSKLSSTDPIICQQHQKWIESLRKYSTLISVSSEKERSTFFEQQREYINQTL